MLRYYFGPILTFIKLLSTFEISKIVCYALKINNLNSGDKEIIITVEMFLAV